MFSRNLVQTTKLVSNISRRMFSERHQGKVKWFNPKKGFGFINPNAGGNEVFVHQSAIKSEGFRSLDDGEEVEYEVVIDEKMGRSKAANVTGLNGGGVKGRQFKPRAPRRFEN